MKPKKNPLTKTEIKQIREYWKPYVRHISTANFQFYKEKTGRFDVRLIPKGIYHSRIDPYLNHPIFVYGTDNKNYYDLLFPEIKQPQTIIRKINGTFCDARYRIIPLDIATQLCQQAKDIVGKEAIESYDGFGISFWSEMDGDAKLHQFIGNLAKDVIVQARIRQHPSLAAIHESSVNPIRIVTLLLDQQIHVLPAVLKVGVDQQKTDRFADGALVCGIQEDGCLMPVAYTEYGMQHTRHPQGFVFQNGCIPAIQKIRDTVRMLHTRLGNYRMLAWDIAIDEDGEPVLVEVNMSGGGSVIIQLPHGPLFGDLTERILTEVFLKD